MEIATQINFDQISKMREIGRGVEKERGRLLNYIKKQVDNADDAEDILQDVMYQFAESTILLKPIEQVSAWLYTVARNRITDLFRKKKNVAESDLKRSEDGEQEFSRFFSGLLADDSDPEMEYTRNLLLDELEMALEELPAKQKLAFERNELEGISFKQMAEESGETVNTWLSRKRYAVLHLRKRLQHIYREFLDE